MDFQKRTSRFAETVLGDDMRTDYQSRRPSITAILACVPRLHGRLRDVRFLAEDAADARKMVDEILGDLPELRTSHFVWRNGEYVVA